MSIIKRSITNSEMCKWRVGSKVRRNLYRGDEPIAMLATERLAAEIASKLNFAEIGMIRAFQVKPERRKK